MGFPTWSVNIWETLCFLLVTILLKLVVQEAVIHQMAAVFGRTICWMRFQGLEKKKIRAYTALSPMRNFSYVAKAYDINYHN